MDDFLHMLPKRCATHNTQPDKKVYRMAEDNYEKPHIYLFCSQCDQEGVSNVTAVHHNVNKAIDEWDEIQGETK